MSRHNRFHLKDLDSLRAELARLQLSLPISEDPAILADRVPVGSHATANRFAVQPMEGFDANSDGGPGELSFRRYARYAAGGSGLIWFEATAILHEARSNPNQLWLNKDNVDDYARLVENTRRIARESFGHELVILIQLTHSGRYSKPSGVPRPIIAHHSRVLDPQHNLPADYPLVEDEYLDRLQETYVEAAKLAAGAGFDGVDIKSCHRYLVSELLASHTRQGKYGGSLANRSRLLRETMAKIGQTVPGLFVTTRMNVYDAISHPFGFGVDSDDHLTPDLREPIELIGRLREFGIPLINVSVGNPYYNPHIGRPFDHPVAGVDPPDEHPLAGVVRFIEITRRIQEAFPDLPVIAGGYGWLRHLMPYVAAGVIGSRGATLIGQGRGAFAYPDSPKDILATGRMDPGKTCISCSGCTQIMRDGTMTGCVVRDGEIYREQYKLGRRFALDHLRQRAGQCRDCEFATCSAGCPASVDVPAFVAAFAKGDIATAYEVLRRRNLLPEMCACVCPAEVQCEGGCLEKIFGDCAVPIRDIQLVVCRLARAEGLTGMPVPAEASGQGVAVVGGGPAGLACAVALVGKGHSVTVFEKSRELGGTPQSIIPGFRYDSATAEVDAILAPAKAAGRIHIELGKELGRDVRFDELRERFDAVFLAPGLGGSSSLGEAAGVFDALAFLSGVKRGMITAVGGRTAVLGAGNTAFDAALTAKRIGARDVFIVYRRSFAEMPAWKSERDQFLQAGGHLLVLTQPVGYATDDQGRLTGLKVARTELGDPDESGRRRPLIVPDSESVMPMDTVIEAVGQAISPSLRRALDKLDFTSRGLVATKLDSQATKLSGVFAGGDIVNGGTTAVQGIAEGMRAAEQIDRYIRGG